MQDLHLLSIILLAISSSLDNFGVGLSYGLRRICFPFYLNLFIAFVNSCGTFFSMLIGKELSDFLQPAAAGYIGAFLLIGIGLWIIVMELRNKESIKSIAPVSTEKLSDRRKTLLSRVYTFIDDPFAAGILCAGRVTMREGALLASALTLSNISTGLAAGIIGFSLLLTTVAAFISNVLGISAGQRIGHYSSARMIKGASGTASGVLLVFIGLYETLWQ
jgi:putative sporulation protein YtaF